jgi:hypothetical protein
VRYRGQSTALIDQLEERIAGLLDTVENPHITHICTVCQAHYLLRNLRIEP